jgi:hypothetical protein
MSDVLSRIFNPDKISDDTREIIESAVTESLNSHYRQVANGMRVRGARGKHRKMKYPVSYEANSWRQAKRCDQTWDRERFYESRDDFIFHGVRTAIDDLLSWSHDSHKHDKSRAFTKGERFDAICHAMDNLANDPESRDEWAALCKCYDGRNPLEYKQLGELLNRDQRTAKAWLNKAIDKIKVMAREYLAALPNTDQSPTSGELEDKLGLGVAQVKQRIQADRLPAKYATLESPSRSDSAHSKCKPSRRRARTRVSR